MTRRPGRAITHLDHLGNEGRTEAGDVQVMSAGTGIMHAEYNLEREPTQIFQIWIRPNQQGVAPRWQQRRFPKAERAGELVALASGRPSHADDHGADHGGDPADDPGDDHGGALRIHQDAAILGATLRAGQCLRVPLGRDRRAYLVAAEGRIEVNGVAAHARDGIVASDEDELEIQAREDAEILIADVG